MHQKTGMFHWWVGPNPASMKVHMILSKGTGPNQKNDE